MPELPEVETIRRDLCEALLRKKIKKVEVIKKGTIRNDSDEFIRRLEGNSFKEINRIGKLLYVKVDDKDSPFLLIHLKMTGQLIYTPALAGKKIIAGGHQTNDFLDLPNKHTRVIFHFLDHSRLFFNDLRRFGYLELADEDKLAAIKKGYGIEPLQKNFTLGNFNKIFGKRKSSIKVVLLNQHLISGIGNIYADEILFAAGVIPWRKANLLIAQERKKIFISIKKIIAKAVECRGTTFSDYVDARGRRGGFAKFLKVYGREGRECLKCGDIIKKTKTAGRGTRFCAGCQK